MHSLAYTQLCSGSNYSPLSLNVTSYIFPAPDLPVASVASAGVLNAPSETQSAVSPILFLYISPLTRCGFAILNTLNTLYRSFSLLNCSHMQPGRKLLLWFLFWGCVCLLCMEVVCLPVKCCRILVLGLPWDCAYPIYFGSYLCLVWCEPDLFESTSHKARCIVPYLWSAFLIELGTLFYRVLGLTFRILTLFAYTYIIRF